MLLALARVVPSDALAPVPRGYSSDDTRGRLLTEFFDRIDGETDTLTHQFDGGAAAGIGMLTRSRVGTGSPHRHDFTATVVNPIDRITEKQINGAICGFSTTGNAFGANTVGVRLE